MYRGAPDPPQQGGDHSCNPGNQVSFDTMCSFMLKLKAMHDGGILASQLIGERDAVIVKYEGKQ